MALTSRNGVAESRVRRIRDLSAPIVSPGPKKGRTSAGTFAKGNKLQADSHAIAIIRKLLGGAFDTEMARDVMRVYRHLIRDLPSDGANVRQLTAARARLTVAAKYLSDAAERAGITTKEGLRLIREARANDAVAQRMAIAAYDIAAREAAANAKATEGAWVDENDGDEQDEDA